MAKKNTKYYVVWVGRKTGIFESWEECKQQIHEYPNARYKSFATKELAEHAINSLSNEFIGKSFFKSELSVEQLAIIGEPIKDSIAVDGAWNTMTRVVEYQIVDVRSGKLIIKSKKYEDGTNNIVEFIAIVHALDYCKKNGLKLPIYSDSRNAINWILNKTPRTKLTKNEKNQELYKVLARAIEWLEENNYENKILKWETKAWGENPADFGRK